MLADYQTLVDSLTRDDADKVSDTERDAAIGMAVLRYSKDKPVLQVVEVSATGGQTLDLPAEWENDFSSLQGIEYPINKVPPSMLANDQFDMRNTPAGLKIICSFSLANGALLWLHITKQHEVTGIADTIPEGDREAVCCLAAASLSDQLASLYSGDGDSTIQADSVDHQSKASEFRSNARALRKRYFDELGIDTKRTVAACEVVSLNNKDSQGKPRLTHGRTYH